LEEWVEFTYDFDTIDEAIEEAANMSDSDFKDAGLKRVVIKKGIHCYQCSAMESDRVLKNAPPDFLILCPSIPIYFSTIPRSYKRIFRNGLLGYVLIGSDRPYRLGHLAALLRSSDHYDEYRKFVTDPALGPQINSKVINMPRLLIGDPKKIFDEEFDINEQHYIIPQIQGASDVKSIVDDKTKLINYIGEIFEEAVTTANKVVEMKVEDSDFIQRQLKLMIESKEIICQRMASFHRIDERALIKAFEGLLYKNTQSVPFSIRL
jgi:hypothetical protein